MFRFRACLAVVLASCFSAALISIDESHADDLVFTGVNLSGAEFGQGSLPGTYGTNYTYPTASEVDYFTSKGMNTFRLPFRWERMQPTPNSTLNSTELGRMDTFVNYATIKGDYVIIDPHNFERYYAPSSNFQSSTSGLIGSGVADSQSSYNTLNGGTSGNVAVTNSMFDSLWSQLAAHYAGNSHVIFNLMNEPNNVNLTTLVGSENSAIAAIRQTGARNLILVPGTSYTGAWTWTNSNGSFGVSNAQAMLGIVDSGNNYAFDMHQYMDSDGSGGHDTITNNDPTIGMSRLQAATQWLQQNHQRGFLGEFAVANASIGNGTYTSQTTPTTGQTFQQIGDETLNNMLSYMNQNSNVWMGWTWWGGGPWWNNYMFGLDPSHIGQPTQTDQPAMAVLQQYLPKAGDFNRDGAVTAADLPEMLSALADLSGWQATETSIGLNATQEKIIADVNGDGVVNNLDLQALISLVANAAGGGAVTTVPEPASVLLLVLAFPAIACLRRKHERSSS